MDPYACLKYGEYIWILHAQPDIAMYLPSQTPWPSSKLNTPEKQLTIPKQKGCSPSASHKLCRMGPRLTTHVVVCDIIRPCWRMTLQAQPPK